MQHNPHGRVQLAASIAHLGVRGLPRRLPVQHQPDLIRAIYFKALKEGPLASLFELVKAQLDKSRLAQLVAARSRVADAEGVDDPLAEWMDRVKKDFDRKWPRERLAIGVQPVGNQIATYNATQLNNTLRKVISVDVVGSEPWLKESINEFTRENVALIKSIPDRFFGDLEKAIKMQVADGARPEELESVLTDRFGVASWDAERIARDQVGKFYGDLNRVRQTDLGIERFVWRTMEDNRVREEHEKLDGQTYEWADPPDEGTPGEPVMCRCYAEPVLEDLAVPD